MNSKYPLFVFIVEGKTDMEALERPMIKLCNEIYPGCDCFFNVYNGDITIKQFYNRQDSFEMELNRNLNETKGLFQIRKCSPDSITHIFHLIDTDGCFISDKCITEMQSKNKKLLDNETYYESNEIHAKNSQAIRNRNFKKRTNVIKLTQFKRITVERKPHGYPVGKSQRSVVPYSIYYFSVHREHCFNNELNPSLLEKQFYSIADRYEKNPKLFMSLITDKDVSCSNMSYQQSWKLIEQEQFQLLRKTNINCILNNIKEDIKSYL